jgi:DNA-binding transcriptional LysR family regulator
MLESLATVAARRTRSVRFHLKTRQLVFLVHLDDERSVARAALATGLTQPAASKLLRQVESTLGVRLFDRHARGVAPTSYGEILLRRARLALAELGLAREEIAALRSGVSGKVAIGTILNPGTNLVPVAVARMKQRYPAIVAYIELDSSKKLVEKLLQGDLDLVVGRVLDSLRSDELVYEPLAADEPHAVIARAQHPLAGGKELRLDDLAEQPWIFPLAGSLLRDKLTAMFIQHGLPLPTNIVETVSLPVISTLLHNSNMVVALPEETVASACSEGTLTVLARSLPLGLGAFGLIRRRRQKHSPAAQLMANTLRELARELYPIESSTPAGSPVLSP